MKESVTGKALWYVESHFQEEMDLEGIAAVCGVTPYHLTRAFGAATGQTLMRYVWRRRLAEAARAVAGGAQDILRVAVEAGYGSHEAFTRAFREEFGVTPEGVRERGDVAGMGLQGPLALEEGEWEELETPRREEGGAMRITGLLAGESAEIPAAWQRFAPYAGGRTAYGVCAAEGYLCGVEGELAGDWTEIRLEPARYLVFRHRGHVSTIRKTWFTIWNRGVAEAGCRVTGAPEFERYGKEFDGRTGNGGLEIWVPVEG